MAGPTQAFEVRIVIGTPMSLGIDVVNGLGGNCSPSSKAVLTQVIITLKDAGSYDIPFATIAALMPALTLLVLLPAFIAVLLAISRTVSGGARTSTLTAGAWDQCRHSYFLPMKALAASRKPRLAPSSAAFLMASTVESAVLPFIWIGTSRSKLIVIWFSA